MFRVQYYFAGRTHKTYNPNYTMAWIRVSNYGILRSFAHSPREQTACLTWLALTCTLHRLHWDDALTSSWGTDVLANGLGGGWQKSVLQVLQVLQVVGDPGARRRCKKSGGPWSDVEEEEEEEGLGRWRGGGRGRERNEGKG